MCTLEQAASDGQADVVRELLIIPHSLWEVGYAMQSAARHNHTNCIHELWPICCFDDVETSIEHANSESTRRYMLLRVRNDHVHSDKIMMWLIKPALIDNDMNMLRHLVVMGAPIKQFIVRSQLRFDFKSIDMLLLLMIIECDLELFDSRTVTSGKFGSWVETYKDYRRGSDTIPFMSDVLISQLIANERAALTYLQHSWNADVATTYGLVNITSSRLGLLPRELMTWYVLPYLGAGLPTKTFDATTVDR